MEVQRKQGHIKQGLAVSLLSVFLLLSLWGCGTKKDDSLADGTYNVEVTLEGGTGRATVVSPTQITVKNGKITATIIWSSSQCHHDMLVGGAKVFKRGGRRRGFDLYDTGRRSGSAIICCG